MVSGPKIGRGGKTRRRSIRPRAPALAGFLRRSSVDCGSNDTDWIFQAICVQQPGRWRECAYTSHAGAHLRTRKGRTDVIKKAVVTAAALVALPLATQAQSLQYPGFYIGAAVWPELAPAASTL